MARLEGNPELQDKMVAMINKGWSDREIAKQTGVSNVTISKWRKRFERVGAVAAKKVVDFETGQEAKSLPTRSDVVEILGARITDRRTPTHEIPPLVSQYAKHAGWDAQDPNAVLEPKDEEEFAEWMVEILLESPRKVAQQIVERFEKECRLADVQATALKRQAGA